MLEFLLTNHPLDCPVCDKGGECELQDMVFRYGAETSRFVEEKIHRPEEKWSDLVYYDSPRCILCFRCVSVCDEGMDVKALGVGMRGAHSIIIPNGGDHLNCEECGMCIDICPVGALTSGTYRYKTRPWEMQYVSSICTHCSNGCKTTFSVRNHEILRANNRDLSGINKEFLCVKGRFGFDFTQHPERIKQPHAAQRRTSFLRFRGKRRRRKRRSGCKQLHAAYGADGIGFIGSNRTSNEENYLLQRLARAHLWHQQYRSPSHGRLHRADHGARRSGRRFAVDDGAIVRIEDRPADRKRCNEPESAGGLADPVGNPASRNEIVCD